MDQGVPGLFLNLSSAQRKRGKKADPPKSGTSIANAGDSSPRMIHDSQMLDISSKIILARFPNAGNFFPNRE